MEQLKINKLWVAVNGGGVKRKDNVLFTKERIRNLLVLLVANNMVVEEKNKIENWYDVLIVETRYSKFRSETTTA